ncbi:MAG: hypothetical protein AAB944_01385 [Patescibacteria group bacterium]
MRVFFVSVVLFFTVSSVVLAEVPEVPTELIQALIQQESTNNDYAIGDKNLKNPAYGPLQVRKPVIEDVNRRHGTNYRAEDCLGNRDLSIKILHLYVAIYATQKRLGRKPTPEDLARIWNGGPNGYKKEVTVKYWRKVQEYL